MEGSSDSPNVASAEDIEAQKSKKAASNTFAKALLKSIGIKKEGEEGASEEEKQDS